MDLAVYFNGDELNQTQEHLDNLTEWLLNESRDIDPRLVQRFATNRNVEPPAFYLLIVAYTLLIAFGTAGNTLVVVAVARKPAMRTARNMFILNLAVSDLLLCLVTMPLTLLEVLSKYWPLGNQPLVCKMIGTLQATSIFVSTISITAIALDRYQVIVYATRDNLQVTGAVIILGAIWAISLVLASPMFIYRTLRHHDLRLEAFGIDGISYCVEDWPIKHGRVYYSIFSLIVQYLLPIIIVSAAYLRIYFKLRYRYVPGAGAGPALRVQGSRNRDKRMQRTNSLLIAIAVIFCISWLPLNIFNLAADLWTGPVDTHNIIVSYAVCHMMGMSSACSNPLLYGWLNDNFRKEFKDILCRRSGGQGGAGGGGRRGGGATRGELTEALPPMTCRPPRSRKMETTTTENGHAVNTADTEMSVLTRC